MPPKNYNNANWWPSRQVAPPYTSNAAGTSSNTTAERPVVQGLAELVEILDAMAASPLGARPKSNQDLIERIKKSPLEPVLKSLTIVSQKLGPLEGSPEQLLQAAQSQPTPGSGPSSAKQPTPAAAPAAAGIRKTEADLKSVSSKLNSVSQAVTDMKDSAKAVKTQLEAAKDKAEAVEKKVSFNEDMIQVSQISGTLDPALAELTQEVKKLEVDLLDEFNGERTRLEKKVEGLETKVNALAEENKVLNRETKKLQQVIRDTSAELLPVKAATEVALQGTFSGEPDKPCDPQGPDKAPGNLLQTAKKVRTNLGKPTAYGDPLSDESLQTSNSKLRNAVVEKEQIVQNLGLVSLVLDQVRRGHDVQLVTQASPRPAGQPAVASNSPASSAAPAKSDPSTTETVIAVSQARTSLSELNTCGYLS
ncbi:hypothetical protein FRC00_000833 [Tulasnella sp. 408]|nr:hypothetical protein FRC00_000833 [Tulasnella sp. 408]